MRHPDVALALVAVLTALIPTPSAAHRYDRSWRFLGGFDLEAGAGVLLHSTAEGEAHEIYARKGWSIRSIEDVTLEGKRVLVLLWESFPDQDRLSPAVYAEAEDLEGIDLLHVWPPELGGVEWVAPRHSLRRRGERLELTVSRDLVGENDAAPRVRKLERFHITASGIALVEERHTRATTPDQVLNGIADRLEARDFAGVARLLERLPSDPPTFRQRAGILLTRHAEEPELRERARAFLEELAADSPALGEAAAERLLEMTWEDIP